MPKLTDLELAELAMCCRIGAEKAREHARTAPTFDARKIHEQTAEFREQLAERLERARKARSAI